MRRLLLWLKRRRLRVGRVLVRWPLFDVREDILIADPSRVGEGLVGVRRRRYGVLRQIGPPPAFPEAIEYVDLASL